MTASVQWFGPPARAGRGLGSPSRPGPKKRFHRARACPGGAVEFNAPAALRVASSAARATRVDTIVLAEVGPPPTSAQDQLRGRLRQPRAELARAMLRPRQAVDEDEPGRWRPLRGEAVAVEQSLEVVGPQDALPNH
jgi:hypothetical protein